MLSSKYLRRVWEALSFLVLMENSWPIFFAGTGNLPPATGVNYTTGKCLLPLQSQHHSAQTYIPLYPYHIHTIYPVSYTHLTLPTKRIV